MSTFITAKGIAVNSGSIPSACRQFFRLLKRKSTSRPQSVLHELSRRASRNVSPRAPSTLTCRRQRDTFGVTRPLSAGTWLPILDPCSCAYTQVNSAPSKKICVE